MACEKCPSAEDCAEYDCVCSCHGSETGGKGISLHGIILAGLGILFVVLKLTHVITWSWLWISLPFWGMLPLVVIVVFGAYVIGQVRNVLGLNGTKESREPKEPPQA